MSTDDSHRFTATRRDLVRWGAGAGAASLAAGAAAATPGWAAPAAHPEPRRGRWPWTSGGTHLVLLGTSGGPPPMTGRVGICSAVVVEGTSYLIDLGHGAFQQIHAAGLDPAKIRAVFLTHLHSDHFAEAYTVPWLRFGGVRALKGPVDILGPGSAGGLPPSRSGPVATIGGENSTPGTEDVFAHMMAASAYDLNIRMRDEGWPDIRTVVRPRDIELPAVGASATGNLYPDMEPFEVFEDKNVRVTATLVKHPPVFPAYGFRVDTDAGSIVFSGDTTVSENLIRLAKGADILVHEVISLDWARRSAPPSIVEYLAEPHTDVDRIGAVAQRAEVKTLVLNHLVPGDVNEVSDAQWRRRAQRGFSGKVVVGHDLAGLRLGG